VIELFKYALAIVRDGRLLLCEPHAFPDLIMPGGVRQDEEDYLTGIRREIAEELGADACVDERSLVWLGHFRDRAAGKTNTMISMDVYVGNVHGDLVASSEISELVWFDSEDDFARLSAIVRNHVWPALVRRELLPDRKQSDKDGGW
jgi:8-oxo-dGTP diphosphatase